MEPEENLELRVEIQEFRRGTGFGGVPLVLAFVLVTVVWVVPVRATALVVMFGAGVYSGPVPWP